MRANLPRVGAGLALLGKGSWFCKAKWLNHLNLTTNSNPQAQNV